MSSRRQPFAGTTPRQAGRQWRWPLGGLAVVTVAALTTGTLAIVAPAADATAPGARSPFGGGSNGSAPWTTARQGSVAEDWTAGRYVVILTAPPAASYTGGVRGLAATKPAAGRRLDTTALGVRRYQNHLTTQQNTVLRSTGVRPFYRYTVASNGFAAQLTAKQAAQLARTPGVLAITKDTGYYPATNATPTYLGLTGPRGVWQGLGGSSKAGAGVVVGVLDNGIIPEHPMFAGTKVTRTAPGGVGVPYLTSSGAIAMRKARGGTFVGACEAGEAFPASSCNSTIISARSFSTGYFADWPATDRSEFEHLSPRDGAGHGTLTASTAIGRPVKDVTIRGQSFGPASGIAPGAKLAVYKTCWETKKPGAPCNEADIVKAIDQAVADGVDVLNFSLGGPLDRVLDPVSLAFMSAASAGVFIAAAAGNEGPGPATVTHNTPWLTSVAAASAQRFENTVVLGDGTKLLGPSLNRNPMRAVPLILGSAAILAGSTPEAGAVCARNSLDPAKIAGKLVVCDSGGTVHPQHKPMEVQRLGGAGVLLLNVTPGPTETQGSWVPTVHLDTPDRAKVLAYLAKATAPTATLEIGNTGGFPVTPLPQIGVFSSRGPTLVNDSDLIKPDIAAPGVSVLSGTAPAPSRGENYVINSGTSLSAPHIAGLAALIFQRRPGWSPMAVKSAMMTTATDTVDASGAPAPDPFAQGAGLVRPKRFFSPGLVYDSGERDWLGYLEGQGANTESGVAPIEARDVNLPSIAVGSLGGRQTVTRTVTAVSAGTYVAKASVPGIETTVTPSTLTFGAAGEKKSFTVTFTRTTAPIGVFATGFLTWTRGTTVVRSPIAVRPRHVVAPADVTGTGAAGSRTVPVRLGTPTVDLTVSGLVPGTSTKASLVTGPPNRPPAADAANFVQQVTVPTGSVLTRFDLVALDLAATDDLDLYVFDADGTLVALSATGAANERVTVANLAPGTYTVQVNAFAVATEKTGLEFELRTYSVPAATTGNLTVSPRRLTGPIGSLSDLTVSWSGLTPGTPYLGVIGYGTGTPPTVIAVD